MITVRVTAEPFDAGAEIAALSGDGVGAVGSFVGVVRGNDGLTALTLEHYPGMTEAALQRLAEDAVVRWTLFGIVIHHRVGRLVPGDPVVFVGTSSAHRSDALDACAYLIDRLKTDAPFWKRESFADGREQWVEQRVTDDAAAARWDQAKAR
ncbi:MAG: molybdenum cofactor biosynthesis protein MoaE [Sphingomonadales bacterium]